MRPNDRAEFVQLLRACYTTLGKQLPPVESIEVWVRALVPYTLEQARAAFDAHMRESSFAPAPADVIRRIDRREGGHVDADEAWAIALRAADERETVVWTAEIAEAWSAARPVFDIGDEVGARMAFKAAYGRPLERARSTGAPARWSVSLGHDVQLREDAVQDAVRIGRLSIVDARATVPLLAGEAHAEPGGGVARQLAQLKALCVNLAGAGERAAAARMRRAAQRRAELDEAKRALDARVAAYEASRR